MLISPALAHADLLSNNLSNSKNGGETCSGGFQDTWGVSDDAGDSWFTYEVYPTQFSVNAGVSGTPAPSTEGLLAAAGFMTAGIFLLQRYRNRDCRN
jgi:hypothetical protein